MQPSVIIVVCTWPSWDVSCTVVDCYAMFMISLICYIFAMSPWWTLCNMRDILCWHVICVYKYVIYSDADDVIARRVPCEVWIKRTSALPSVVEMAVKRYVRSNSFVACVIIRAVIASSQTLPYECSLVCRSSGLSLLTNQGDHY